MRYLHFCSQRLAMADQPIYYTAERIQASMSMAQCIDAMAFGFSSLHQGQAIVPDRVVRHFPGQECTQLIMPAVLPEIDLLVTKLVTVNEGNKSKGLPLIHALVTAQQLSTGANLGIFDGAEITSMRTAAASGLATRLFANAKSSVLGIVGTGVQAKYHVAAMLTVLPIRQVIIKGRRAVDTDAFCSQLSDEVGVPCSPAEGLREADVVCTCTTATSPVLSLSDVKPGAHINAVGSFRLTDRELSSDIIAASDVIIDDWGGCIAEAGDVMIPIGEGVIKRDDILGELGYWVNHKEEIKRKPETITVFKSVGNAVQDAAAVACILGLL